MSGVVLVRGAPSFFRHPIEDLPFFFGANLSMMKSQNGSFNPWQPSSHQIPSNRQKTCSEVQQFAPEKTMVGKRSPFLFGFGHFSGVILNFLNFGRVAFAKPDGFKQFFF